MKLADVALPVPMRHALTYLVPASMTDLGPGSRVVCPLGARRATGVVTRVYEGEPPKGGKPILSVVQGALPAELVTFMSELAAYYYAPIGEVMKLALPPVDRETAKSLAKEPTLFDQARGIQARQIQWAAPTAITHEAEVKLSANAKAVLAHLRGSGGSSVSQLQAKWSTARQAVGKLAELGLITLTTQEKAPDPFFQTNIERDSPPVLNDAQEQAVKALTLALEGREARAGGAAFLLDGVTGSGKTEVYLHAIERARELGHAVIVLVPEISLTPQLVGRYRARFGDEVCVLHSALTPKERLTMWQKLQRGEITAVIGARSALFAPITNLGLLIVDEEHDGSFKQEEGVRYHARDMAILRAHRSRAVCVLGSATPSLESARLVQQGKVTLLELPNRARAQAMPKVEIIDLRRIGSGPSGDRRLTLPLFRAIEKTLERKEQSILFLNRRGFAPSVRCESCGTMVSCPNCAVALTLHKGRHDILRCHYCSHEAPMPQACSACSAPKLALEGVGTERLEEAVKQAFPQANVARLDRDVTSGKGVEAILDRMRSKEIDVLVGTQMVTKGHDLPEVTLVGVINADAALSIPDFRAAERAFQLLVQVAGRAGRGDKAGRVLVQTFSPDHHAIAFALAHDVRGFQKRELKDREELGYPPFSRMAIIRFDAVQEADALDAANAVADAVRSRAGTKITVLGPSPAPLPRLRNRFRFHTMLRAQDRGALRSGIEMALWMMEQLPSRVRAYVDVDPMQIM